MEPGTRTPGAWVTRTRAASAAGLAAVTALGLGIGDRAEPTAQAARAEGAVAMAASEIPPGFGPGSRLPQPEPVVAAAAEPSPARPVTTVRASREARPADAVEQFLPAWVPPVIDSTGIPVTVLKAYRNARRIIAGYNPACNLSTALLSAIGRVESDHAFGGYVDKNGRTLSPILGPRLDGHPGVKSISDSDEGFYDGDRKFDRAVGPMQFIPTTWVLWAADGNQDKVGDPNNVYDAALSAGWYLCHGGVDLTDREGFKSAVLRYNGSMHYYRTVRAWTQAYAKALNPVPDTKDAAEAQRRAEEKAAAERAAAAATARAAAQAAARQRAEAASRPVAAPESLAPALEPAPDGNAPAETGAGKAAPSGPVVPRAPQPAPDKSAPAPAKPGAPAAETGPSTDERRDQKPASGGVGTTIDGLTRPKGGGTPPAAGPAAVPTKPAAVPTKPAAVPTKPTADAAPTPPPTGVPLR